MASWKKGKEASVAGWRVAGDEIPEETRHVMKGFEGHSEDWPPCVLWYWPCISLRHFKFITP